jgi:two-component system, sensor histidine kinase and response regulator
LGEMLGVDPAQLIGRAALTLIDRPQRAADQGQLQRLLDGQTRSVAAELQIREDRSQPLWINLHGAVISDADGRPEHLVLQLQDITERKQYEH